MSGTDKCSVKLALLIRWDTKGGGGEEEGGSQRHREDPCSCPTQSKQRKMSKDAGDFEVKRTITSR